MTEVGEQLKRQEDNKQTELMEQIAIKQEKIEAEKRKQSEMKKRMKQIELSNTYKAGKLVNPIASLWKKVFGSNDEQEAEITLLKQQLLELETELIPLRLLNEDLNEQRITQYIRTLKEEGKLLEQIDAIIQQKKQIQENYKQAIAYTARLYMNEDDATRNVLYEKIIASLATEEIPELVVRAGLSDQPISLRHTSSFRGSLTQRIRKHQLTGPLPEWFLDDKQTAYHFVAPFGIQVPHLDETTYTEETLPEREGIVIKPVDAAGARGVYLVHKKDYIFDVRNAKILQSFSELHEALARDLKTGAVTEDSWLIEQLIYENEKQLIPARDVKFYSFYGKVGLILEIVRDPEIRHTWWTRDGKRISTGKYEATLFAGQGVSESEIEQVEQLSSEIPAPFMRIDFLRSESGLVFGEFTPKPGNYDEFDDLTDAWLGDYFIEAEGRLVNDLLNGKTFTAYKQFVESIQTNEKTDEINV